MNNLIYIEEYLKYPIDDGYTLEGMKRTVADWFLLSNTNHIFMTKSAGFGQRAARLNNIPYDESIDNSLAGYFNSIVPRRQAGLF